MPRDPLVIPPGEGPTFEARGSRMTFKATAATTAGAFSLMERELPPGGRRPPPHVHTAAERHSSCSRAQSSWCWNGQVARLEPRGFALVPRGSAHSFGNAGTGPARVLVLHAPAMDPYFRELEALWSGPAAPTAEAELALMRRHGTEPA